MEWSVTGEPTIKTHKVSQQEKDKTVVPVNLYFVTIYWNSKLRTLSLDDGKRHPFNPSHAARAPRRMWRYQAPELKSERFCMKKNALPVTGQTQRAAPLTARIWVLVFVFLYMVQDLCPIPWLLRRAWRAYRRSRRPLRERRRRRHRQE